MSPVKQLSSTFDKKWTSYILAGSAMLAVQGTASAVPITLYSGDSDGQVSAGLDVDGDSFIDFTLFADGTPGARSTSIAGVGTNGVAGDGLYVFSLLPGTLVDGTTGFGSSGAFIRDQYKNFEGTPKTKQKGKWPNDISQVAYAGLKFDIGGQTHYGWAAVSTQLGSATLTVRAVGYETAADTPVTVQDISGVPEPSSMALLLMGAAGVAVLKRRRAGTTT